VRVRVTFPHSLAHDGRQALEEDDFAGAECPLFFCRKRARLKERRHLCSVDVEPERGAWPSSARRIGGTDAASGGRHLPRA
jgi:hypothetical protein